MDNYHKLKGFYLTDHPIVKIDRQQILQNCLIIKKLLKNNFAAVIKANAYHLGIKNIIPILLEAGIKEFFVSHLSEAIEASSFIKSCAIPYKNQITIHQLSGYNHYKKATYADNNILPVINSLTQYKDYFDNFQDKQNKKVFVHMDTGMNRLGIRNFPHALQINCGLMTHLTHANDITSKINQHALTSFNKTVSLLKPHRTSIIASAGLNLGKEFYGDLARIGITLYGISDKLNHNNNLLNQLSQAISIQSPIIAIYNLKKGQSVSYGSEYTASKNIKIGILAFGYADGINTSFSNNLSLRFNNIDCPIIGRITMDYTIIDMSEISDTILNNATNNMAVLTDKIDPVACKIKNLNNFLIYEFITSLSSRVKKIII